MTHEQIEIAKKLEGRIKVATQALTRLEFCKLSDRAMYLSEGTSHSLILIPRAFFETIMDMYRMELGDAQDQLKAL